MYDFNFHRPDSLAAAASLLSGAADGAYLAGGMTLIPTLKQRLAQPSDLIDLGAIAELDVVTASPETVTIGAMTRHAAVASFPPIRRFIPALADLAGMIGDAQVRNRGTIGGSVANSDPAADYPAAVVALGATINTDRRTIAADDFFKDLFTTALQPGELIRSISFPVPTRAAYCKFPNPASRYAVAGVFVADFAGRIRVGVTGAGPCAFRWTAAEQVLGASLSPGSIDGAVLDSSRFNSDLHASAEFRANLVKVMAKRAVAKLLG